MGLKPCSFWYPGRCPKPVRLEETSNPRLASELEMCGTKKLNFTGTRTGTGTKRKTLPGPEPGPEKNYPNRDRDQDQIKRVTGAWTGTGIEKSWSRTYLVVLYI